MIGITASEQQVDQPAVAFYGLHSRVVIGCAQNSVSLMLKRLCDELSDDQFIFNNQHRLSPREQTVDPVRLT